MATKLGIGDQGSYQGEEEENSENCAVLTEKIAAECLCLLGKCPIVMYPSDASCQLDSLSIIL